MKALQKASKFLSDYTSIVVIAIAVVTFFLPSMMGWVNLALFTDMVSNKFTCQSIIIGIIMFSMGLTLTTEDFRILAQRPFDICVGAVAQYLIMPFLAFALSKVLNLPDGIALGLILVGCCPGGVSSNIMSYLCGGDVAFSVGMTTVSTLVSPVMTPLMVSLLASGTQITIKGLPMFVSIIETVILPVGVGFLLNYLLGLVCVSSIVGVILIYFPRKIRVASLVVLYLIIFFGVQRSAMWNLEPFFISNYVLLSNAITTDLFPGSIVVMLVITILVLSFVCKRWWKAKSW